GEYTIALNYPLSCGTFTEEKTILITGPPVVDILGLSDLCEPGSITPTSNVSSCGSEETIYEWTFEGGLPATFQGEVPGEVFFETPGEKAITLKVTNNCGITEITKTMVVYALQEIDLGPSQEICLGESATLSPTLTHDEGNFSYAWTSVPNSAIPNATSREITVAPKQNTVYKLSVTNMDSNCSVEEEMEVKVLPAPEIVFSLPDQIICSGETTVPVMLSTDLPGNDIAWNAESPAISGLESTGTDQIPAQTLVNDTNLPVEVQFIASITSSDLGSCSFLPVVYTV